MTQKISILTLAVIAAATLAAERFVGADGNYPSAGDAAFGVTNTGGAAGERVPVDVMGTSIATAGDEIEDDELLQIGTEGKLVPQTTGVAVAKALQAASADGDRIEVLLLPSAGVRKAAAQADSVAADVATLKTDFNALLAKLRTAGVIAT